MITDCTCPKATSLTTITAAACGLDLGQIQRMAFQRLGYQFDDTDDATNILKKAAWDALKIATDDTKVVITPMIGGDPIIDAGDAITSGGGDNSTLDGVEEVTGVNPGSFSCVFKSMAPANEREMKTLICEGRMKVYFFLQGGKIACWEVVPGTAGDYQGFNADNVFLGDRNNAGFGAKDTNAFSFQLPAGYSNNLVILTPEFNPLTDI